MTQMPDYRRGVRYGIRWAITWLHRRADEMNDPYAKAILNTAAFNMGNDRMQADDDPSSKTAKGAL